MSFVIFPALEPGAPALFGMVVGTNGLAPDEAILGRSGHARKVRAIASWINQRAGRAVAWAKRDPVRIDLLFPRAVRQRLPEWKDALEKYGRFLYLVVEPPRDRTKDSDDWVLTALTALVDLFFHEREIDPMADELKTKEAIERSWLRHILPDTNDEKISELLDRRRFAILEGPPGTGKTEMARRILNNQYRGRGAIVQFHPGTTYESFVGGLAPEPAKDGIGLSFVPAAGHLMRAAQTAGESEPFLLVIDEINRADLAKVLGEAFYLFEPDHPEREITLAYDFKELGGRMFRLPRNLHVLGTMNSADRSIAILDVAVRRRFAFVPLWPQLDVVERNAGPRMQEVFRELLMLFVEHATDDAFSLLPGHAYFLAQDEHAASMLKTGLAPLLEEYVAQGHVAAFVDEMRAFLDRLASVEPR